MKGLFELIIFVLIGVILLWFGYTLFFHTGIPAWGSSPKRSRSGKGEGRNGERQSGEKQPCPVCSARLEEAELVSSLAFPSINGGKDRLMHIRGCHYCLGGERERICPVCGTYLLDEEILVCRFYERPGRRAHIHVLGCSECKKPRLAQSRYGR